MYVLTSFEVPKSDGHGMPLLPLPSTSSLAEYLSTDLS